MEVFRRLAQGRSWPCPGRSEEHTSELQSRLHLVCRLLLEKKKHLADLDAQFAGHIPVHFVRQLPDTHAADFQLTWPVRTLAALPRRHVTSVDPRPHPHAQA